MTYPFTRARLSRMRYTVLRAIRNLRARYAPYPCVRGADLISSTASLLRRVLLFFSPCRTGGFAARPLAIMSRTFAACVPAQRWAGFTQRGLSHSWQTTCPFGISPFPISQDSRDATHFFVRQCAQPYPLLTMVPIHSQHSDGAPTSTYAQKAHSREQNFSTCDARINRWPQFPQSMLGSFMYGLKPMISLSTQGAT